MAIDYSEPYTTKDHEFFIDGVMDRWDLEETDGGSPKKVRAAYADWKNSMYHGAIMKKRDLQKLRKWCDYQLEHFDDEDKETVFWDRK